MHDLCTNAFMLGYFPFDSKGSFVGLSFVDPTTSRPVTELPPDVLAKHPTNAAAASRQGSAGRQGAPSGEQSSSPEAEPAGMSMYTRNFFASV